MWVIGTLIALAVLALTFFLGLAYSIRWYEEARQKKDDHGLWDFSWRDALPILIEFLCQAALISLALADLVLALRKYPWRRRRPKTVEDAAREARARPGPSPGARPVVLLHGLGMRGLTMYPLARRLRREGRRVHTFTYWPPGRPIRVYARQLHDFLEEICRSEGCEEFDAAAHSMGGLVLRKYLSTYDGARRVKRIVTIGTPHGGSELWRFSLFPSGRELRPGGETLRGLDAAALPPGVEATAIASDFDELVIPNRNARWEAPGVENRAVPNAGHARLVFHPETHRIVREALA